MKINKFLCDKVTLYNHKTGEVISEKILNPPHRIDFNFPTNVDMDANDIKGGTFITSIYNNPINFDTIIKKRGI